MSEYRYPISDELRASMRDARDRLGLRNADLARKLGVDDVYILNLLEEHGRKDKSSIYLPDLAEALGMAQIDWLPLDPEQRRLLRALDVARSAGNSDALVVEFEDRANWALSKRVPLTTKNRSG